jgi:hypothetical protein
MHSIRVSQGEAHKLNGMLNQVVLNKGYRINTCPVSDVCRVTAVESAGDCNAYSTTVMNVCMLGW